MLLDCYPAIPAATACAQQQRAREGAAPGLGGRLRHRSPRGPGRHTKAGCNPTQFVEDYGGFLGHFEMVLDKRSAWSAATLSEEPLQRPQLTTAGRRNRRRR